MDETQSKLLEATPAQHLLSLVLTHTSPVVPVPDNNDEHFKNYTLLDLVVLSGYTLLHVQAGIWIH